MNSLANEFLLERGLPAKNDDAECLANRGVWFAGKPRSNRAVYSNRLGNPASYQRPANQQGTHDCQRP